MALSYIIRYIDKRQIPLVHTSNTLCTAAGTGLFYSFDMLIRDEPSKRSILNGSEDPSADGE